MRLFEQVNLLVNPNFIVVSKRKFDSPRTRVLLSI